jgi:hypothetical protein
VNGINTNSVDLDLFNGDFDALMAMTAADVVCGDGTCSSGERYTSCPADCPYVEPPFESWIGGPCRDDADCLTGLCLTESDGYRGGMCTERCDLYCPDRSGHPVTFCVSLVGEGHCFSRRSYDHFSGTGCREDYHAEDVSRHNQPSTVRTVCSPDRIITSGGEGARLPEPAPEDVVIEPPPPEGEVLSDIDDVGDDLPPDALSGCSVSGRPATGPLWLVLLAVLISCRKKLKS